jgi:hypothetical protein
VERSLVAAFGGCRGRDESCVCAAPAFASIETQILHQPGHAKSQLATAWRSSSPECSPCGAQKQNPAERGFHGAGDGIRTISSPLRRTSTMTRGWTVSGWDVRVSDAVGFRRVPGRRAARCRVTAHQQHMVRTRRTVGLVHAGREHMTSTRGTRQDSDSGRSRTLAPSTRADELVRRADPCLVTSRLRAREPRAACTKRRNREQGTACRPRLAPRKRSLTWRHRVFPARGVPTAELRTRTASENCSNWPQRANREPQAGDELADVGA